MTSHAFSSFILEENAQGSSSGNNSFIESEGTSHTALTDTSATYAETEKSSITMAIDLRQSTVGCSVYFKENKKMTFYLDTTFQSHSLASEFATLFRQWKSTYKPGLVLIPSSFPTELEHIVRNRDISVEYEIKVRPHSEFSRAMATQSLSSAFSRNPSIFQEDYEQLVSHSHLRSWIRQINPESADLELNAFNEAFFDQDNQISAGCISALLAYLTNEEEIDLARSIKSFSVASQQDSMIITADSISALHLFQEGTHPNLHYSNTNSRSASSSLFNVLNETCSPLGSSLMKEWFFRPSTNIELITSRHDVVQILTSSENIDFTKTLRASLRKVKNIPRIVRDLEICSLPLSDWNALVTYLEELQIIISTCAKITDFDQTLLAKALNTAFPKEEIIKAVGRIYSIISFERSAMFSRVVVQEGVNQELDSVCKVYNSIEVLLAKVTEKISKGFPDSVKSFNALYFPQLGYLVVVTVEDSKVIEKYSQFQEGQWAMIFSTETHCYYKNNYMREMDAEYGDIFGVICDYELEIIHALQTELSEFSNSFNSSCNILAQLDCHQALAWAARINGYTRPNMMEDRSLVIEEGFHPLYVKLVDSFIPNNISLVYYKDTGLKDKAECWKSENLLLVTGANYSGKTVYLTQTALIVFMAQIGSFVPAKSSTIGIVDRILTRITTRESVSRSKSSFMNDLEQVSSIFRMMTPRSLLIIDEFGKGTETRDGAALFGSLIKSFQELGSKAPKVVASTHFHELLEQGIIQENNGLKLCHMEIFVSDISSEAGGSELTLASNGNISYLYKVQPGKASSSFGICCAKLCGVDEDIIKLAEKIYQEKVRGGNFSTFFLRFSSEEKQRIKIAGQIIKRFLQTDMEKVKDAKVYLKKLLNAADSVQA